MTEKQARFFWGDLVTPIGRRQSFTVDEVRQILRVSRATVYDLINSGQLKIFKIGRLTRVTGESLDALMAGEEEVA